MSKYNAKKTMMDGILFDSMKEAKRYQELKKLEAEGRIQKLERQVPFTIIPKQGYKGETIRGAKYIADFVYTRDGEVVAEDVKGMRSGQAYQIFKLKKKLMLYQFGIYVEEI